MRDGSARPTKGKKGASKRRLAILRAAERLLRHYGFAKTTVADIAREAKVGVGTVYLEFPSKSAIVAELSFQRYRCVLEAMREAAAGPGNSAERLTAMFAARAERFQKFSRQGQHGKDLIRNSCPATGQAHERFCNEVEDLVTEFLEAAVRAGELDAPKPRATARILLIVYGSAGSGPGDLSADLAIINALVLRGLLPRAK